ncbi:MAG: HAMP domain-containing protein [Xanthobacteraceae bacterium]|nr:HAMP domain-containing protein [Xanthobacteraceae bacterium]
MNPGADRGEFRKPAKVRARGQLFRKYVTLFAAVVAVALIASSAIDTWFSYLEQRALLIRMQQQQAETAATRISQFIKEIESQMGWLTQTPWDNNSLEEWQFDSVRLLRQVPAITELARIDATGHERARVSRIAVDVVGTRTDVSRDPMFVQAMANKRYHGPIYFRRESEPYMTLAIAGSRPGYGVVAGEVNLKFIWDLVSEMRLGMQGTAFVVDSAARLIAHSDISLVLRNIDLSHLAHVQAARISDAPEQGTIAKSINGQSVLTASAPVPSLGWTLFIELPVREAYAPLYASVLRSGALLLAALVLAVLAGIFLARRMIVPIRVLRDGAARIGRGDLTQRISIDTGDELQALGDQFNSMAEQLQDLYSTLERKVEQRTAQLELANQAKSRFLAAASHDLRQPLHALGLFVAQLRESAGVKERSHIVDRVDAAIATMNDLFNALLDISKLDAGALAPKLSDFPIRQVLRRIETTFAGAAREKGLSFRIIPSDAWVRSDSILLERILLNLISNAIRYTQSGGIVVGCRKRDAWLRIEVCDTGRGIPEDQHQKIFGEFYRAGEAHQGTGLGLGLAIVDRLCGLLGHPIQLASKVGRGSRFTVMVPAVQPTGKAVDAVPVAPVAIDRFRDKLIVVVDDDPLVLDGMSSLLRSWGCRVLTAATGDGAIDDIIRQGSVPDLIVSDYRLPEGQTGFHVIAKLRGAFKTDIPAFVISGDINAEPLQVARQNGFHLLHKPVAPMTLRAMLNRMLKSDNVAAPTAPS